MPFPFRRLLPVLTLPLLLLVFSEAGATAQISAPQANRVAAHPDVSPTTRLSGHVPAWATAANDLGPASSATTLRLTFVLSRSPERQAAFTQLLADQQNPASPNFHHWLTPQQIGVDYGPTQDDVDAFTAWLTAQGLPVAELAPSHLFVTVQAPLSTVAADLEAVMKLEPS